MKGAESPTVFFRSASVADVERIVALERAIWGSEGANQSKILSRIKTFIRGNVVAVKGDNIIGYISFQYVERRQLEADFSWEDITDKGTIARSHSADGSFTYGVNLTVAQSAYGLKLGNALLMYSLARVIEDNREGSYLGSRIPGFRRFKEKNPDITVHEYVHLRWKGKLRDPELRMYEEEGFRVEKVLPGYFPDQESLDYGVLIFLPNACYNKEIGGSVAMEMQKSAVMMVNNR